MSTRRPSSFGAAIRSALVPGWGQLATNRPVVGRVLVFITGLMVIAALTAYLFVEPVEIAAWLIDPDVILVVVLANIVFAAIRLLSAGHAWLVGGRRGWFAALFVAAIIAVPHAAIAWVGLETRDSLMRVFSASSPVEAAPPIVSDTTTTTSPPRTTTTELHLETIEVGLGEYGPDDIEMDFSPPPRPFGDDRLNVLLLGGDAGPGRSGLRTDTMIVASVDPITGDAALIGVPRNFGGVEFKDGTAVPVQRLNHVYWWGTRNPDGFDGHDPGAAAIQDVIENITGLEIDYHMLVDLTGFADLVDVLGGVRLEVPVSVNGPLYDTTTGGYEMVQISSGVQVLDGDHALAYARARYGSSDYARMGRQRCLLAAMARDVDRLQVMTKVSAILEVVEAKLSTDLPIDLLPDLVRLADRVDGGRIRVVGFDSTWNVGRTSDGHAIPDVDRIRNAVASTVNGLEADQDFAVVTAEASCS